MKTLCGVGLLLVVIGVALVFYQGVIVPNRSGREMATADLAVSTDAEEASEALGPLKLGTSQNPFRVLIAADGQRSGSLIEPAVLIGSYEVALLNASEQAVWQRSGELRDDTNARQVLVGTKEALEVFELSEGGDYHLSIVWRLGEGCREATAFFALRRNVSRVKQWQIVAGIAVFIAGVTLMLIGRPREDEESTGVVEQASGEPGQQLHESTAPGSDNGGVDTP